MGSRTGRESERIVGLAVDMEIAARATVFIGNGVSDHSQSLRVHACHVLYILSELTVSTVVHIYIERQPALYGARCPARVDPHIIDVNAIDGGEGVVTA
ncbi:hypothetical protein JB92DRAFT_2915836, partial [Gautieria morchelliformis]